MDFRPVLHVFVLFVFEVLVPIVTSCQHVILIKEPKNFATEEISCLLYHRGERRIFAMKIDFIHELLQSK